MLRRFEVKTGSIARLLTLLRESLRTAMKRKRLQSQRTPPLEKTRARLEMVRSRLVLAQSCRGQENFSPDISSYWKSVRAREKATRSTTSSKAITNNQGSPACLWKINIAGRHTTIVNRRVPNIAIGFLGNHTK